MPLENWSNLTPAKTAFALLRVDRRSFAARPFSFFQSRLHAISNGIPLETRLMVQEHLDKVKPQQVRHG
jgi:hypothetical protein